jgi:hypothetical protein
MSTETQTPDPNAALRAEISAMVQGEGEKMVGAPTAPATAPSAAQAAAAPSATQATTAAAPGTLGGKFKDENEAIKAHHLLIHSFNATKAEVDAEKAKNAELLTRVAALENQLSPGRVDPAQGVKRAPESDDDKWREGYGIDPADLDARIERKLAAERAALEEPRKRMVAADAYMAERYPEFLPKVEEVKAFIAANEALRSRVATLWQNQLFAEAMEIGYLAYDNALRAASIVAGASAEATTKVNMERGDASLIPSQAAGARESVPAQDGYPQNEADWERIRKMRAQGKDAQVREILLRPLIAHIPELNQGR